MLLTFPSRHEGIPLPPPVKSRKRLFFNLVLAEREVLVECGVSKCVYICVVFMSAWRYVLGELDLDELRSNNRSFDKPLRIKMDVIRKKTFMGYAIKNSMLF